MGHTLIIVGLLVLTLYALLAVGVALMCLRCRTEMPAEAEPVRGRFGARIEDEAWQYN